MKKNYANASALLCACALVFGVTGCRSAGNKAPDAGSASAAREGGSEPTVEGNSKATALPTPQPSPTVTTASVAGTYHYNTYRPGKEGYDNTLKVEDKGDGSLHISLEGAYMYRANGAETMHDGDGEGDATLSGDTATGRVLSGDSPCGVVIIFEGDKARLKLGNNCDNSFYILDGTYIKEKRDPGVIVASDPAEVVRAIYRDYFAHKQDESGTLKRHRAQFSPELRALWEADKSESDALATSEGMVGLDFDPFTSMQDTVGGYTIGTTTREGNDALVPVKFKGAVARLHVRLTQSNDTWLITNFHYDGGEDLVKILKDLAKERRKNFPDRYKKTS